MDEKDKIQELEKKLEEVTTRLKIIESSLVRILEESEELVKWKSNLAVHLQDLGRERNLDAQSLAKSAGAFLVRN